MKTKQDNRSFCGWGGLLSYFRSPLGYFRAAQVLISNFFARTKGDIERERERDRDGDRDRAYHTLSHSNVLMFPILYVLVLAVMLFLLFNLLSSVVPMLFLT